MTPLDPRFNMLPIHWQSALGALPPELLAQLQYEEPMSQHTTLRIGGPAQLFLRARSRQQLALTAIAVQSAGIPHQILGDGSNVCFSDRGLRGFVIRNSCSDADISELSDVDAGHGFMRLFQKCLANSLTGLEWAVGIPGTVGGALVSNAGAYGGNICDLVERIDVVENGERKTVGPEWMEFSYRDSRLRRDNSRPAIILGAELKLKHGNRREIRLKARDIQYQRICKQPWEPSAGSFFKNIHDRAFAEAMPGLPELFKNRGVVTSAFLIDKCGLKGYRLGDAAVSARHANFLVNHGRATAQEVRALAKHVVETVSRQFGITLEEEVLYSGDW